MWDGEDDEFNDLPDEEEPEDFPDTAIGRIQRQAKIAEFEREVNRVNIGFSRKPYWEQAREEGDYLPEDSGITSGDRNE